MTLNWADTGIGVTEFIGNAAGLAVKIGKPALPIIQFMAGFIPGLAPAIQVLSIAEPILEKIAAGAPIVESLIKTGKPTMDALQAAAPDLLYSFKELYAVAVNNDPSKPESNVTANQVSNEQVASFVGSIFEKSFFTPQDRRFENQNLG